MAAEVSRPLPDPDFWRGRRVLLTGHTGFKGSWLTAWLKQLGAEVMGVSLPTLPTEPSLWAQLGLAGVHDVRADIATDSWTTEAKGFSPEVVLHLAAQPLVSVGYAEPARTFEVNVQGTVQVMDLLSDLDDLMVALVVTTDKVYDPHQSAPHTEDHHVGGLDPYAASKAAAELVVRSWPGTFTARATARAGNVIGGGDWADGRLLPDLVRAWGAGERVVLRCPQGVRPWQHVLEPLRGYLLYAEALAAGRDVPAALNFGPADGQSVAVAEVVAFAALRWRDLGGTVPGSGWVAATLPQYDETPELTLDSRLATDRLGWAGALHWHDAVTLTLEWYRGLGSGTAAADLVSAQLRSYTERILEASA
jgi:CDP-glucose 4,6-dehydratase